MDKNKVKEALKKKLKQEMSVTGTGASVTPGVGAGVATKYAFGKRDNKGTPSDWKAAPSIPNRKSKAMDYKELWEFDATSFFQGQMIQQAMQSAPAVMSETEKIISIVLLAIGTGAIGGGLAAIAKDKLGSLNPIPAIKHWFSDRQKRKALEPIIAKLKQDPEVMKYVANKNLRGIQAVIKSKLSPEEQKYIGSLTRDALSESMDYKELWEGKMLIGTDTKTDSDIFFEPETGTFSINVIDAAGNRTNKLQVNTIDDVLAKFPSWKWTDAGKAEFADSLDEAYDKSKIKTNADELARVEDYLKSATSSQKSPAEDRIKKLKYLVGLEKKHNTQLPVLHYGMFWVDYLKKQGVKNAQELDTKLSSKKENMNEENIEEAYVPENIKKFAQRKGVSNIVSQVARWAEKMGKRIVGGTAIGKNYSTLILDLTHQGGEIRINTDTDEIEINDQDIIDYKSFADAVDSLSEPINENYARFRNETKTRTKPEQFHNAVKEVKKKVQEINRLFEYMNRLQSELKESEGGLKTKKYTESALQQIKEATKQLFFKSTKLK